MRRLTILAFALAGMGGAPAVGGTGAESAQDLDKVICKQRPQTNTRFKRKICMTRGEWDAAAEAAKRQAAEEFNRSRINPDLGKGG